MPLSALPLIARAGDLVTPSALLQAGAITLAAVRAIRAAAAVLRRKRLAWRKDLEMPIALALESTRSGTETTAAIVIMDASSPRPAETQDAWLVLLTVTNTGLSPISSGDFTTPLAFAFPGRQVHAAQVHPRLPHSGKARRPARRTQTTLAIRAHPGSSPAHIQLTGPYLLKRNDEFTLMVVLTGTPAVASVHQEGSLPGGRITAGPPDPDDGSKWLALTACATSVISRRVRPSYRCWLSLQRSSSSRTAVATSVQPGRTRPIATVEAWRQQTDCP